MIKFIITSLLSILVVQVWAQADQDILFSTNDPLHIAFRLSIKTIKNEKFDTVYFKEKLYFDNMREAQIPLILELNEEEISDYRIVTFPRYG